MGYYGSIALYILLGCVTLLIAGKIEKYKKISNIFCGIFIQVVLLSVFPALRSETTGIDMAIYMPRFEQMHNGIDAVKWYGWGKGLVFLINLVLNIFHNTQWIIILTAFITNALIIIRLYELCKSTSYTYAVFVYYCMYYFYTYNIFRQMLAVAIVFYAGRYIRDKKYIRYAILIFVACQIHLSSILGLIYLGIDIVLNRKQNLSKKMFLGILILICAVVVVTMVYSYAYEKIEYYFGKTTYNFGIIIVIRAIFYIFNEKIPMVLKISNNFKRKKDDMVTFSEAGMDSRQMIRWLYGFGLIGVTAGCIYSYMDRLGLFFVLYEGVYWGGIYKKNSRNLYVNIFSLICIYTLFNSIFLSEQGQTPYSFFWKL